MARTTTATARTPYPAPRDATVRSAFSCSVFTVDEVEMSKEKGQEVNEVEVKGSEQEEGGGE
jgi:uncharacterized OsmC-like protein